MVERRQASPIAHGRRAHGVNDGGHVGHREPQGLEPRAAFHASGVSALG